MKLFNPEVLTTWLPPHSIEWYAQVSRLQGKYLYPWQSTIAKPNGESLFDQEVMGKKRVVRAEGKVLGLHPGDDQGKELAELFPGLFPLTSGTPILDMIHHRLEQSRYQSATVETFSTTEYLLSPADVIKVRCFGQCPDVMEAVLETNLSDITKIFEQHASLKGLPITYSRYIVRAIV